MSNSHIPKPEASRQLQQGNINPITYFNYLFLIPELSNREEFAVSSLDRLPQPPASLQAEPKALILSMTKVQTSANFFLLLQFLPRPKRKPNFRLGLNLRLRVQPGLQFRNPSHSIQPRDNNHLSTRNHPEPCLNGNLRVSVTSNETPMLFFLNPSILNSTSVTPQLLIPPKPKPLFISGPSL